MSSTVNDETLLTLLAVDRENEEERNKILSILQLEPTRRKIAVNILVTEMRRKNAPEEFVAAWDSLQNDSMAEAAKGVIEDAHLEPRTRNMATTVSLALVVSVLVLGLGLFLFWLFVNVFKMY